MAKKRQRTASGTSRGARKKAVKVVETDTTEDSLKRDIDWDQTLTWALVSTITDNENIRQALFPGPGANPSTAKGGGKTKTEAHALLAEILFADHEAYGLAYQADKTVKAARIKWATKIKNRVQKVRQDVMEHMNAMDQTGAGIMSKDEIDFSRDNAFTNLARFTTEKVLLECPWFFEMKVLIAQRPNVKPVGLGNALSAIDETVLFDESDENDHQVRSAAEEKAAGVADVYKSILDTEFSSDEEPTDPPDAVPMVDRDTKTRELNSKNNKKKVMAPSTKKVKLEDKFLLAHTEEEKTRQKAYDAKIAAASAEKTRAQSRNEYKLEKLRLSAKLAERKMEHRERMAAYKAGVPHTTPSGLLGGHSDGYLDTSASGQDLTASLSFSTSANFSDLGDSTLDFGSSPVML
ncbi:hypothetical protein BDW22DRAFT_1344800 [Trametopsis cervina]|nr:hypothetical protein BDW22DRAFT_1344800 [Trametopsis cervina]